MCPVVWRFPTFVLSARAAATGVVTPIEENFPYQRSPQVRLDTAHQRKLHAISVAREGAYARYANIYKDHAAERYANAIEGSRQKKGGLDAYRRRVIAASTDAERYRGYVEANTPRDDPWGESEGGSRVGLLLGDGSLPSEFDDRESSEGSSSVASATMGKGGRGRVSGEVADGWLGDGTASECSGITGTEPEGYPVSGGGGMMDDGDPLTTTGRGSGGGGGGSGAFVDVVPFNNIRAKYLRPMNDVVLSRPYHVAPLPDWRAGSSAGSRSTSSSLSGSSTPHESTSAAIDNAGHERTMEAYRKMKENCPTTHRRHSKTLKGWKEMREWGVH